MIDIKLIRETPDLVKEGIKKREMNLDSVVDEILVLDGEVRLAEETWTLFCSIR